MANDNFNINFYLDGVSIVSSITALNGNEKSLYEFFIDNNIVDKYPFDQENRYSYEEWNKYKVKTILNILVTDLKDKI